MSRLEPARRDFLQVRDSRSPRRLRQRKAELPLLEESTIVGLSSRMSALNRLEKVSSGWESISESHPLTSVVRGIRLRLCGRDARRVSLGLVPF